MRRTSTNSPESHESSIIGAAFGGGGARGIAHVGVLRSLRRNADLVPNIVAGTSAGSIVAALFAADISQEDIEEALHDLEWFRNVVSFPDTAKNILDSHRSGVVSNKRIESTINELIGDRSFDELPRRLAIPATDLDGGRRVIFTSTKIAESIDQTVLDDFLPPPTDDKPGFATEIVTDVESVGAAVAASCAIPGLFHPVEIGDSEYVDGGVVDQVPVDIVRAMGADPVVAISLSFMMRPGGMRTLGSLFSGVLSTMGSLLLRRSLDLADVGFEIPGIGDRSIFDLRQYDLIEIGEKAMDGHIDALREAVENVKESADKPQ